MEVGKLTVTIRTTTEGKGGPQHKYLQALMPYGLVIQDGTAWAHALSKNARYRSSGEPRPWQVAHFEAPN